MKQKLLLFLTGLFVFIGIAQAQDFITKWKFGSATSQIQFFVQTAGPVNYSWSHSSGSGSGSFNSATLASVTIGGLNLPANTEMTLHIEPANFRRFFIRNAVDSRSGLIDITQWGAVPWATMQAAFANAPNLNVSATDVPDLSNVTNLSEMFFDCASLTGPANIGSWTMTNITDMSHMFSGATSFNQPIGTWNTSNVTTMQNMFYGATVFNQPLNNWQTSNVTNMRATFYGAAAFNQPLNNWNTASVTTMSYMFHQAFAFNQPIGNWDVHNVLDFSNMLYVASSFNQNLGNWKINPNATGLGFTETAVNCENYSLTLKGWAENNPTVTGRGVLGNGRTYGPAAVPYRDQLLNQGWTITNDTYNANCSVVLPVLFGSVTAVIQNNQLQVDWTTLSENNSDHFIIEASADGEHFTAIGQLNTQTGNGAQELHYQFSKKVPDDAGLPGLAALALCGLCMIAGVGRRGLLKSGLVSIVFLLTSVACNKADAPLITKDAGNLYIRIKQVDKDATFRYSKIVKVIVRN